MIAVVQLLPELRVYCYNFEKASQKLEHVDHEVLKVAAALCYSYPAGGT